jgi:hypothetical protein
VSAAAWAAGPARLANEARRENDVVGTGPRASEGEVGNDVREGETVVRRGGRTDRWWFDDGSPLVV